MLLAGRKFASCTSHAMAKPHHRTITHDAMMVCVWVRQAFFTRWWAEQTERTQALVQRLVADGQLDFVNGGWVQVRTLLSIMRCNMRV